jgi:hypothetical protein
VYFTASGYCTAYPRQACTNTSLPSCLKILCLRSSNLKVSEGSEVFEVIEYWSSDAKYSFL